MGAERADAGTIVFAAAVECSGLLRGMGWHVSRRLGDISPMGVETEIVRCYGLDTTLESSQLAHIAALILNVRLSREQSERRIALSTPSVSGTRRIRVRS